MKKHLYQTASADLPEGRCLLEYYLVSDPILTTPALCSYGIEVVKRREDSGELTESKTIADLSRSEEEIRRIIALLARNTVTPVSLHDVLEDLPIVGNTQAV